jgi:hypothetical protein
LALTREEDSCGRAIAVLFDRRTQQQSAASDAALERNFSFSFFASAIDCRLASARSPTSCRPEHQADMSARQLHLNFRAEYDGSTQRDHFGLAKLSRKTALPNQHSRPASA